MANALNTELSKIPPKVEFEDVGLGTMRTSGTCIALMLQLESPEDRAEIFGLDNEEDGR